MENELKGSSQAYSIEDMSMFMTDPNLLKNATVINPNYAQGLPLRLADNGILDSDDTNPSAANSAMISTSEPGVLCVEWIPTPGVATDSLSPINRAGTQNYRKFRVNNWSQNYLDIPDVSIYFLATASSYVMYNYLGMVYKHILNVERFNLYSPQTIVEALGVDYNNIVNNQARLLNLIQQTERKIKIMALPKSFGIAKRWLAMSSHVYKDRDLTKAQYIVLAPKYLLKYDIATASLKYVDFKPSTPMTISDLESKVNEILSSLYPDEEMMRFNADITNYVTKDIFNVYDIDWKDMTTPIYSEGLLKELHNADFISYTSVTGLEILQRVNPGYDSYLEFDPIFTSKELGQLNKRVIDVEVDEPSGEDIVRATRWKFTAKLQGNLPVTQDPTYNFKLGTCGTELIMNPTLYVYDSVDMKVVQVHLTTFITGWAVGSAGVPSTYIFGFERFTPGTYTPHNMFGPDFNSLYYLPKFNKAPLMYLTERHQYNSNYRTYSMGTLGEVGNLITLPNDQLNAINADAMLSAFGVNPGSEMIR